jgi:hypothetical protein
MKKSIVCVLISTALMFSMGGANANVMTFDSLVSTLVAPSLTEDGITATGTANNPAFVRSQPAGGLHLDPGGPNNSGYDFTFGGLAFDLISVDVLTHFNSSIGAIGLWTGFDAANVQVVTFSMDGSTNHTEIFSGFNGLNRVHLENTGAHFNIDNVQLSATRSSEIPEPVSSALVGLGLLGIALNRRKQA